MTRSELTPKIDLTDSAALLELKRTEPSQNFFLQSLTLQDKFIGPTVNRLKIDPNLNTQPRLNSHQPKHYMNRT